MLTFKQLEEANMARLPLFRNNLGEIAHTMADGSDWSLSDWLRAVVGEVGEYANVMKKAWRGDFGPGPTEADRADIPEARQRIAEELADVDIYLSILYARHGIDREQAIIDKWNATSRKIGVPLEILHTGDLHYAEPYEIIMRESGGGLAVPVKVPTSCLTEADLKQIAERPEPDWDGIPF